ncbi:hypothetical protein BHE74_00037300 [Ensete ventricosum]|nr:hypothetical protein BHE74_00037300 [Ensete ventricosum]
MVRGEKKCLLLEKPARGEEISPRSLKEKSAHPTKPMRGEETSFSSPAIAKDSPREASRSPRARIGIKRAVSDLQVLPFLLPLLFSPSIDTARNRPTMVKIDRYCPKSVETIEIDRYWSISGGNETKTIPINGTAR